MGCPLLLGNLTAWRRGYEALAKNTPTVADYGELAAAVALARAFLEPALAGHAHGLWDPATLSWSSQRQT